MASAMTPEIESGRRLPTPSDATGKPDDAPGSASADASGLWRRLGRLQNLTGSRSENVQQGAGSHSRLRPWVRGNTTLSNTWQVVAGAILTPLGVLFILLGWYGAAHAAYVQQQIPYLVSGGFIGLGCVILGGLLYWAHWLYRIYDQADLHHVDVMEQAERQHKEQLRVLEQTLRAVAGGPGSVTLSSDNGVRAGQASEVGTTSTSEYLATATGTVYHVASCAIINHRAEGAHTLTSADVSVMKPCRICLPDL
jgi:hypothetical protein